ncbi:hypothetical protein, partial [Mucilaginibacter sp.]|uniref:hypothetical protein n=1 Tax=Mucilaginibacter sp. TaxID=1882438 RepID=UPI00260E7FEE
KAINKPRFLTTDDTHFEIDTLTGTKLVLAWDASGKLLERTVNEKDVAFADYRINNTDRI